MSSQFEHLDIEFERINKLGEAEILLLKGEGGVLSEEVKQALLQLSRKVAYIDEDGQTYYNDLYQALYPPATLVEISAVYTQSGVIYPSNTLDDLKEDLIVTATYSDGATVEVSQYILTGMLLVGDSLITVNYGGKTDTFVVEVTRAASTYTITNALTGCSSSNSAVYILEDSPYTAIITANANHTLVNASVEITMGNEDITSTAYNNGTIFIEEVTGDIEITIVAVAIVITSISAVYTQSGVVYDTDSLDSLKSDLVVTAIYNDASTAVVTNYSLDGTLVTGTSTITVTYQMKSTAFNVTVTHKIPEYVTDGLVIRLDAINNTGNGHDANATVWKDLVGNYDVSVPSGSATWNDDALVFTGQQKRQIKNAATPGERYATVEIVYAQNNAAKEIIAGLECYSSGVSSRQIWHNVDTENNAYGVFVTGNSAKGYYVSSLQSLTDIRTVQIIYANYQTVYKVFINGIEATQTTGSAGRAKRDSILLLGNRYDNNTTECFHGKIMAFRYYNKQLTDAEIMQNFVADRERFELEL